MWGGAVSRGTGKSLSYPTFHHCLVQDMGDTGVAEVIYMPLGLIKSKYDTKSWVAPMNGGRWGETTLANQNFVHDSSRAV